MMLLAAAKHTNHSTAMNGHEAYFTDTVRRIPRSLHFIWLPRNRKQGETVNPIPAQFASNVALWRQLHPSWSVRVWRWSSVALALHADSLELLSKFDGVSLRADLLRLLLLQKFGGVYLDADITPLRPIDPVLEAVPSAFTVCQHMQNRTGLAVPFRTGQLVLNEYEVMQCSSAANAVIALRPGHPAAAEMVQRARDLVGSGAARGNASHSCGQLRCWELGAQPWTLQALKHSVRFLHPRTFYPCHWTARHLCDVAAAREATGVFAMHHWSKTWGW